MLRHQLAQLKTGRRDLRRFGLVVGGVFALLAVWCWWRGKTGFPYALGAAVPLLVLGAVRPASLKWVYLGWMCLGLALGVVVSALLLTVFFYVVLTPLALLARLQGKDFLRRRLEPSQSSYWMDRPPAKSSPRDRFERQF